MPTKEDHQTVVIAGTDRTDLAGLDEADYTFEIGTGEVLREGKDQKLCKIIIGL